MRATSTVLPLKKRLKKRILSPTNRPDLKKRISVQNDAKLMPNVVQGSREVKPAEILWYFEDLNRAPNTEFGLKDFFEMGSNRHNFTPLPREVPHVW